MKLVFDARYTRINHHDGISRYTAGVLGAVSELADVTMLISDERQLAMLPALPHLKVTSPTSPFEPLVALQVNKLEPDLVFSPMQTMGTWGKKYPVILTLHDLIYYSHPRAPKFLPAPIRIGWFLFHQVYWPQRVLLNRADAVATVSETTAGLMRRHRLTRRHIGIVSNAPAAAFSVRNQDAKPKKSLLYMGSFMEYKNVETLISAMGQLPDYELHLLSGISEQRRAELERKIPIGARVVFHNGVQDSDYELMLKECTALVTMSEEEGFGLPLVEAMSVGTPVVASDIPIFREVGGDAALFAPAKSPSSFAQRIRQLDDFATWQSYARRAEARATQYSWQRSAEELMELCKYVLDHSRV